MRVSIFDYAPSQQQQHNTLRFLPSLRRWTQHVVRQVWPPAAALFPLICLLGPSPVPLSFLDLILTHTPRCCCSSLLLYAGQLLAARTWCWPRRRNNPTLSLLLMILGPPSYVTHSHTQIKPVLLPRPSSSSSSSRAVVPRGTEQHFRALVPAPVWKCPEGQSSHFLQGPLQQNPTKKRSWRRSSFANVIQFERKEYGLLLGQTES